MDIFSKRLRELRTSRAWTQAELASKIGVGGQAVSQYERGVRRPDQDTLIALSDVFNVSLDYLLGKDSVTPYLITEGDMIYYGEELNAIRDPELHDLIIAYIHADKSTQNAVRKILDLAEKNIQSSAS